VADRDAYSVTGGEQCHCAAESDGTYSLARSSGHQFECVILSVPHAIEEDVRLTVPIPLVRAKTYRVRPASGPQFW